MTGAVPHRLVLAIDSSTGRPGAALADSANATLLAHRTLAPPAGRGEVLASLVSDLLDEVGASPAAIGGIGVVAGPGSYTGLRVGLALARGISMTDDVLTVGVGSLELMALAAPPGTGRCCPVLDASGGKLYAAGFERGSGDELAQVAAPEVIQASAIEATLERWGGGWAVCDDGSADAPVNAGGHSRVEVSAERVGLLAEYAARRLAAGDGVPAETLLPIYVGRTGARPNRHRVKVNT